MKRQQEVCRMGNRETFGESLERKGLVRNSKGRRNEGLADNQEAWERRFYEWHEDSNILRDPSKSTYVDALYALMDYRGARQDQAVFDGMLDVMTTEEISTVIQDTKAMRRGNKVIFSIRP